MMMHFIRSQQHQHHRWSTIIKSIVVFLVAFTATGICNNSFQFCHGMGREENKKENKIDKDIHYRPTTTVPTQDAGRKRATTRAQRFPSIEDRIKLYMSNWYIPPCDNVHDDPDNDNSFIRYSFYNDDIKFNDNDNDNDRLVWQKLDIIGLKDHPLVVDVVEQDDGMHHQLSREKVTSNATTITTQANTTVLMKGIQSIVEPDMLFYMDIQTIKHCSNWTYDEEYGKEIHDPYLSRIQFRHNMRMYCSDIQDLLLPSLYHIQYDMERTMDEDEEEKNSSLTFPPILIQFGDNKQSHVYKDVMVPHIKKFRSASLTPHDLIDVTTTENGSNACYSSSSSSSSSSSAMTTNHRKALNSAHGNYRFQPIIWKLATDRHYKKLYDVYRYDTQWSHKQDMAVFRGQLTGSRDGYNKKLSDEENCYNLKRCRLVYNHGNSTLINARLTSTRDRMPNILNGVELVTGKVKINSLLAYKGIIMIEGNDVASGLKWALLSQSIVLMPKPKHTSWCMEELLQPWVHYIPLNDFATNVEERMQWIIDNDKLAQRISERATLWMEDLVFHPDAKEDDRLIQEEILRRYIRHFKPV